jgi:hypothetical protein
MIAAIIADPIGALISEARRYLAEREQPVGSNRSTRIDYWLVETGAPLGAPWCAAFVAGVGRQALGAAWPVPRTASVQQIVDWADPRQVCFAEPERGDLLVIHFPELHRFAHVGIVTDAKADTLATIEANTNPNGEREGYGVFTRQRPASPRYRFVRWAHAVGAL